MKSYSIDESDERVVILDSLSEAGYILYCYDEDVCIRTECFPLYEDADSFGKKYLDFDEHIIKDQATVYVM